MFIAKSPMSLQDPQDNIEDMLILVNLYAI